MAVRITLLLLSMLYVTGLVLSAPTSRNTSQTLTVITKHPQAQAASERASVAETKRSRIFRVDGALGGKLSKTDQPTEYFLDATLDLLETSQDTEVVPVFASDKGKSVIIDTNGGLMASYGSEKFVPVWGRERNHHGFHRPPALGQRFALFILGFSLALAVICSCVRE
ncbi:hypothetical protein V8C37DRAFT_31219 [Trichoderma ceciliae]